MAKKGTAVGVPDSPPEPDTTLANPGKPDSKTGTATGVTGTATGVTGTATGNGKYTVVARRYRPKTFAELVGQATVSQALLNAIESNRVGHAYLFTGARGVGKTSTARIFAKALNAAAETNGKFDPNSDISQAIDAGEDMDVLEIDGASNRGIDEIRQLRSNAAVRPSRSRYKIYIIDEVHMLTTQAFNALLKTLEEPPGHVKFIFCTTDPEKITITVLSRCQRFDFPPVKTEQIFERLKFICQNEGTQADEAALRLIARRAAGSMRDSQSLLEQLLSFSGNRITVEVVHAMLGTADETRLASFASRLIERDAAGALRELNTAADEGVDVGQLAEQLLGYLRDMMTVTVGGSADLVRTANPSSVEQLKEWGKTWGTMTLLSALQMLDETIVKMRHSVQSRILLEVALVQICNLQDLQALSDLVKAFSTQSAPPPRTVVKVAPAASPGVEAKKKVELSPPQEDSQEDSHSNDFNEASSAEAGLAELPIKDEAPEAPEVLPIQGAPTVPSINSDEQLAISVEQSVETAVPMLTQVDVSNYDDRVLLVREEAVKLGGLAGQCAMMTVRVDCPPDRPWKICLSRDGAFAINYFQTGENGRKLAQTISSRIGRDIQVEFVLTQEPTPVVEASGVAEAAVPQAVVPSQRPTVPQAQLIRNAMVHPLIKQFMDVFEGQVVRVDPAQNQVPAPHLNLLPASTPDPQDVPLREKLRNEVRFETSAVE